MWLRNGKSGDPRRSRLAGASRWQMRTMHRYLIGAGVAFAVLCGAASEVSAEPGRAIAGTREWIVGDGDSWFSMRSRICPVETLREANPDLADQQLRPGERILSPFVGVVEFDAQKTELDKARELAESAARQAAEDRKLAAELEASTQGLRDELAAAQAELRALSDSRNAAWAIQGGLIALALLLAAGLVTVVGLWFSARRTNGLLEKRIKHSEDQYADLRRSIADLDVQLQRRMLKLLSWHDTRVLSQEEVAQASTPVVEMAKRLKERHAG